MKFSSKSTVAFLGLLASSALFNMNSVQGHMYDDDSGVWEGHPTCFCLDGNIVVSNSTDYGFPKSDPCKDHGGEAKVFDYDQELTLNCNIQSCETIQDGQYRLGFPDIPAEINAMNAGMVHSSIVHHILSSEPRSMNELRDMAEHEMTKRRWPKWKITITIKFLFFEIEIEFGGGGRRLGIADTDENRKLLALTDGREESRHLQAGDAGNDDIMNGILDMYRWEAQSAWEYADVKNGIIGPGGCTPYPELFDWLRTILILFGKSCDENNLFRAVYISKSLIPNSAEKCSQEIMEAYADFAPVTQAFWIHNEDKYTNRMKGSGDFTRRRWPWLTDLVSFGGSLGNGNSIGDSVLIGAVASAKKFFS